MIRELPREAEDRCRQEGLVGAVLPSDAREKDPENREEADQAKELP